MWITNALQIKRIPSPSAEAEPLAELVWQGQTTGKILVGACLEAAYTDEEGRILLFLTEDVPFEERLHIYLLNDRFEVLDSASISQFYTAGIFSDAKLAGPRTVQFRFIGAVVWSVELLSARGFRLPFFSDPFGVKRPFGFSCLFRVSWEWDKNQAKPFPQLSSQDASP